MADAAPHVVRVILYPGVQALDVVGPVEVFNAANRWLDTSDQPAEYMLQLVGPSIESVSSESPICLTPTHSMDSIDPTTPCDTVLVPGGLGVFQARDDVELVRWIRTASAEATRVASVCSGTFLLAEAGLLDGRTVTTHWSRADQLAGDYSELTVDPDPIYIRDGRLWTSAGVTAGIDLALAIIESDIGVDAAQTIARHLVMFTRRPGGQSQFAPTVWTAAAEHEPVRAVQDHVAVAPADDLSVPALAALAGMSERNFARVFTREVGESPGRYVERVRVDAARHHLETTDVSVDALATTCGFGTAETMRRAFIRHLGVAPTPYRQRFATHP